MLPRLRTFIDRFLENRKTFGLRSAVHDLWLTAINRVAYVRILRCVAVAVALDVDPCPYEHGFADPDRLRHWARSERYEMPPDFLVAALAKDDRCYAIWDGDTLASYGWYSTRPTAIDERLTLSFDPSWVYMYKGFTDNRYRGQRLHAIGMTLALRQSKVDGGRGLVSYVESNNFASLRSCYRMGYEDVGWIGVVRLLGRDFVYESAGCRAYGLKLEARGRLARGAGVRDSVLRNDDTNASKSASSSAPSTTA